MALAATSIPIPAPAHRPRIGGIHSVAPLLTPDDPHEIMGVVFETDACVPGKFVSLDPDSCLATEEKDFDDPESFEQGLPFHVYGAKRCTGLGNSSNDFADFAAQATLRLERGRETLIEQELWERTFRDRAVDANVAGALAPAAALGRLEEYAGENYTGRAIIHVGFRGAERLASLGLIERDGERFRTKVGSDVVIGAGYTDLGGPLESELASPVLTKGAAGAGGAFAAGTYFWTITAIDADGETLPSNEVTATLTLNQQQVLNWAAIPGATGYNVYRGTAAGAEDHLITTTGAVATYTDTGTAGTPADPPDENTTDAPVQAGAGNVWMYVTGTIELRAGEVGTHQVFNPEDNQLRALAEQSIVPTIECLVAAVRMSLA